MTIMLPRGAKVEDSSDFVVVLADGRRLKIPKGVEVEWPTKEEGK